MREEVRILWSQPGGGLTYKESRAFSCIYLRIRFFHGSLVHKSRTKRKFTAQKELSGNPLIRS